MDLTIGIGVCVLGLEILLAFAMAISFIERYWISRKAKKRFIECYKPKWTIKDFSWITSRKEKGWYSFFIELGNPNAINPFKDSEWTCGHVLYNPKTNEIEEDIVGDCWNKFEVLRL